MKKRLLSLILAVLMLVSLFPAAAIAEEDTLGEPVPSEPGQQPTTEPGSDPEPSEDPAPVWDEANVADPDPVPDPGPEQEPNDANETGGGTSEPPRGEGSPLVLVPICCSDEAPADPEQPVELVVSPYETVCLKVEARPVDAENLSYQWDYGYFDEDLGCENWSPLEGVTDPVLELEELRTGDKYRCTVYDQNGNFASCVIQLRVDNSLVVTAYESSLEFVPGDSVTLTADVQIDSGGYTCQWFVRDDSAPDGWRAIEGAAEDSYETGALTEDTTYECRVSDYYGNSASCSFYLSRCALFTVEMGCDAEVCLPAVGAETTLSVVITAEETETISCRWYNDENPDDTLSEGETLVVSEEGSYSCTVSDDRGHSETVSFYVFISGFDPDFLREHAVPVSAGQETAASIDTSNDIAIFSFTTEETGTYTATAITDPGKYLSAELLNAEGYLLCADEYNGAQSNFGITWDMEAGETYYLIVNYRDDSVGDFLLLLASPLDNNLWIKAPDEVRFEAPLGESVTLWVENYAYDQEGLH